MHVYVDMYDFTAILFFVLYIYMLLNC